MSDEILGGIITTGIVLLFGWGSWITRRLIAIEKQVSKTNCQKHDDLIDNMKMQIQALEIQDREHEKISDIIKAIPELIFELKNIGTEFKEFKNDFRTAFKDYSDKLAHITRKVEKHEFILKDRGLE